MEIKQILDAIELDIVNCHGDAANEPERNHMLGMRIGKWRKILRLARLGASTEEAVQKFTEAKKTIDPDNIDGRMYCDQQLAADVFDLVNNQES